MLTRLRAKLFGRKLARRRAVRTALVVVNAVLLLSVIGVVVLNPAGTGNVPQTAAAPAASDATTTVPLDQLASVNIAVTVARMTNLIETAAVINQADSTDIQLALASANNTVVDKPQAVSSVFLSNKDIHKYVVQAGDTVSALAAKFGVSSDSIRWSNSLAGDTLLPGKVLEIPPANGIVYIVQAGDTPDTLATKFHASKDKIIDANDAEISGLHVGEQIIIPDGTIVAAPLYSAYGYVSGFAWGSGAIYGFNGYDFGNCTWYVATQISVPANWGNADTWASGARAAGWHVSSVPTIGAIAQTPAGGLGHVAIVNAISPDGSKVFIREMNDYGVPGGGFDRVDTVWEPTATYPNYITAP